jgi:hypothetical protein
MKTIYNALYLSIFLHFLRIFLSKFITRDDMLYSLYIPGCNRKNRDFTVLVATSPNYGVLRNMGRYLDSLSWTSEIAVDGTFVPDDGEPIINLNDPELRRLFSKNDYAEIADAINHATA